MSEETLSEIGNNHDEMDRQTLSRTGINTACCELRQRRHIADQQTSGDRGDLYPNSLACRAPDRPEITGQTEGYSQMGAALRPK